MSTSGISVPSGVTGSTVPSVTFLIPALLQVIEIFPIGDSKTTELMKKDLGILREREQSLE